MPRKDLRSNVWWLGLTSMFTDVSTEMLAPIMPFFLRMIGAGAFGIGLIEGLAHATERGLSVFAGWASDKLKVRKPIILLGYGLSTVMKALYVVIFDWPAMIVPRFFERSGKAIRNPPRDALIVESVPVAERRVSFALHRILDTIGALVGPIVSFGLVVLIFGTITESSARTIFLLAVIPSAIAVALLWTFVREPPKLRTTGIELKEIFDVRQYGSRFVTFLTACVFFYLAWPQQAFFYLKLNEVGFAVEHILLLATAFQASYIAGATLITKMRMRPKRAIEFEFVALGFVFLALAFVRDTWSSLALFLAYGALIGVFEVDSRVYIPYVVPKRILASAFGTFRTATGMAIIISGILIGALWSIASMLAFIFAGALTLAAAVLLWKSNKKYEK